MRALILIDLQNDFMPAGPLGVPEGNQVIPVANTVQKHFDFIVASQDWHPPDHGSFARNHPGHEPGEFVELGGVFQVLWPAHCVQDTEGADFVAGLERRRIRKIIRKGSDPGIDSYSAFFDNGHQRSTGLWAYLREHGIGTVYLMGLATDYCVKFSALDARELGFDVTVIEDGCRGVGLNPGDVDQAIREMRDAGVKFIASDQLEGDPGRGIVHSR